MPLGEFFLAGGPRRCYAAPRTAARRVANRVAAPRWDEFARLAISARFFLALRRWRSASRCSMLRPQRRARRSMEAGCRATRAPPPPPDARRNDINAAAMPPAASARAGSRSWAAAAATFRDRATARSLTYTYLLTQHRLGQPREILPVGVAERLMDCARRRQRRRSVCVSSSEMVRAAPPRAYELKKLQAEGATAALRAGGGRITPIETLRMNKP